ncbi:MAG: hypothetical protein WC603_01950, partial [Candidatus Paceibacterota bacterium]
MKKSIFIKVSVSILILIVSIFTLFPSNSQAGWLEQQNPGLHNWQSIASSSDGQKLVAVGGYSSAD